MLRETVQLPAPVESPATVLLPAADLAAFVKVLRHRDNAILPCVVTIDPTGVTLRVDGSSVTVPPYDGTFPNVEGIIPTGLPYPLDRIAFGSKMLAKIAKVAPSPSAKESATGPAVKFLMYETNLKPIRAEWEANDGESLFAVVMPVRTP